MPGPPGWWPEGRRDRLRRLPQPRLRQGPRARARLPRAARGRGPRRRGHRGARAARCRRPRPPPSTRCGAASTSSTRRRSSTATGCGSPTSCCASTSRATWVPGATTSPTPSSPVGSRFRPCSRWRRMPPASSVLQGVPPQWLTVVTGDAESHPWRLVDVAPYARRRRAELLDAIAQPRETESARVQHCGQCRWKERCAQEWLDRDDLIQVAGMRADHRAALIDLGIPTLRSLAQSSEESLAPALSIATRRRLLQQARLQLAERETGQAQYELPRPRAGPGPADAARARRGRRLSRLRG